MKERGQKRKFRQERLKTLQFLVIPALHLTAYIWLEHMFQGSIQFGFEDIKGWIIPHVFIHFFPSSSSLPLLKDSSRLEREGAKS